MVDLAPTPTRSARWSPIVADLRAESLDCLQANVAAVADQHHGTGSHLALGARLRFRTWANQDGPPQVEVPLRQRLTEAQELLGLRVAEQHDGLDGPAVRDLANAGQAVYVVADAYTMGWLPYAGRQHLQHSFLVTGAGTAVTVVDAYHDDTRWGPARPGVWRLPPARFDAAVPSATAIVFTAGSRPRLDPVAVLATNAGALRDARPDIDRYLAGLRDGAAGPGVADRIVLDGWLLSRARALHAGWLATTGAVPPDALADAETHARAWLGLATRVFVAARRGDAPSGMADQLDGLLHEDLALADRLAAAAAGGGTTLPGNSGAEVGQAEPSGPAAAATRAAVLEALSTVFQISPDAVVPGRLLRDLPNFNSFRLVDVIERVESRLGVELGPDDLSVESLRDLDTLCAAFARAAGSPAGSVR